MDRIFEIASRISNEWSLAAFAIVAVVMVLNTALRKRSKANNVIWGVLLMIGILASIPIVSRFYLASHAIYRVRVMVLDPHGVALDGANLTSSLGGEPKRVAGGWEFDVPAAAKPADGKLTIYAVLSRAFLKGKTEVLLTNDFNPAVTLNLSRDESARILGIVTTRGGQQIRAATVGVIGYESESVVTGTDGNFVLAAHAAEGQQTEIYVHKSGYNPVTQWCEAGGLPITIVLEGR